MLRHGAGASAQRVAWSFFSGWVVKVGFTVALLVVAFRSPKVHAAALLAAYVATFVGYWIGAARGGGQKTGTFGVGN
jgi:F0F1-type ATP synthase assembly protein I